jgi:hypothetical protein
MTLVQLRHLIALAHTGSFSKAAQAQFLTQPALSRSIRALEDELGLPLFDRVGRRVELTPFGHEPLRAHSGSWPMPTTCKAVANVPGRACLACCASGWARDPARC